jgi:RHS repeat-associated protein
LRSKIWTDPNIFTLNYTYTQRNEPWQISGSDGAVFADYRYDAAGRRISRGSNTGTTTKYTYTANNQIASIEETVGSSDSSLLISTYSYDAVNRMVSLQRKQSGVTQSFTYDLSNRLTSEQISGPGKGWAPDLPAKTVNYTYDGAGNRKTVQINTDTINYEVDSLNAYTHSTIHNGQSLTGPVPSSLSYDQQSRLISAQNNQTTLQCAYDGLGRCVKRTLNGVTEFYLFDGPTRIVYLDPAGNSKGLDTYGAGMDEHLYSVYNGRYWKPHQDAQGNVNALSDWTGQYTQIYDYDAFGAATMFTNNNGAWTQADPTQVTNRFLFKGREWLDGLNIYDFRARAYSPSLGRFMQLDPARQSGGNNLYTFCNNNPVTGMDPTGLYRALDSGGGGGGGGGAPIELPGMIVEGGMGSGGDGIHLPGWLGGGGFGFGFHGFGGGGGGGGGSAHGSHGSHRSASGNSNSGVNNSQTDSDNNDLGSMFNPSALWSDLNGLFGGLVNDILGFIRIPFAIGYGIYQMFNPSFGFLGGINYIIGAFTGALVPKWGWYSGPGSGLGGLLEGPGSWLGPKPVDDIDRAAFAHDSAYEQIKYSNSIDKNYQFSQADHILIGQFSRAHEGPLGTIYAAGGQGLFTTKDWFLPKFNWVPQPYGDKFHHP